ncbi:MAG: helix-turn-helix transcriptional regulator [Betaproteobacteria bacterium]|nr:helix-turn-helix transcriptional regulator [Betaproteobacteria bacterium]
MERLYKEFGRILRSYRKEAHLSQLDLANRVGLSRTSITNIESGRQHIPLHFLYTLASAVGTSPEKLLPGKQFALLGRQIIALDSRIARELDKQELNKPDRLWIERIVLKTALEKEGDGNGNESREGSRKNPERIRRKRQSGTS